MNFSTPSMIEKAHDDLRDISKKLREAKEAAEYLLNLRVTHQAMGLDASSINSVKTELVALGKELAGMQERIDNIHGLLTR